jgi:hypothetical protein
MCFSPDTLPQQNDEGRQKKIVKMDDKSREQHCKTVKN